MRVFLVDIEQSFLSNLVMAPRDGLVYIEMFRFSRLSWIVNTFE